MDALSALGIASQGIRLMKQMVPSRSQASNDPATQATFGDVFLNHLDGDGDGALSLEEVKFSEKLFNRLDTNGDGALDLQELNKGATLIQREQGIGRRVSEYLESHDADHNAVLSMMESGLDESLFGRIDTNQDKSINRGEITSAYRHHTVDLSS